jgi:hypothetical protein
MTERMKSRLIKELKLWAPMVNRYTELNGYSNFDFFYNPDDKCWECLFFDHKDQVAEAYISKDAVGIINQLIPEPK